MLFQDGHEICFVGDEAFRELSQVDPKADELLNEVSTASTAVVVITVTPISTTTTQHNSSGHYSDTNI